MSKETHIDAGEPSAQPADDTPQADEGGGRTAKRRGGGLIAWLALLLAAAGIGGGYYLYQQRIEPLGRLPETISQARGELEQRLQQQAATLDELRNEIEQQRSANELDQQRFQGLEQNIATVRGQAWWTTREWKLSEIRYLVRMADDRLRLMHDRATAMTAIKAALGRLAELSDPTLEPLRQRLQHDLQQLALAEEQDPQALIAGLEEAVANIQPYPRDPLPETDEEAEAAPQSGQLPSTLEAMQKLLAGRIRIVHHDQPLDALEGSRVAAHQLELLKMRLLALRLALMQGNREFYRHELRGIELWLQSNQLGPAGQAIAAEVEKLRAIDPFAEPPSLQPTLDLIGTLLATPLPGPVGNMGGPAQ